MKLLFCMIFSIAVLTLTYCTTSKKAISGKDKVMSVPAYTYTTDVAPILEARCSPCHYPGGRVKFLDTYGTVSSNIDEIIRRIELPRDSSAFMPFKSKKEPLSDSLIQVIKLWKAAGMAQ